MFLHWHNRTESEIVGDAYFYASGSLYYILNNQINSVATFPNSINGPAAWSGENTFITTASSSVNFNFYSVVGQSITTLPQPSVPPLSSGYGSQAWDQSETYLAIGLGSKLSTGRGSYIYKRDGNNLTFLTNSPNDMENNPEVAWRPDTNWLLFCGFANTQGSPNFPGRSIFLYTRSGDNFTISNSLTSLGLSGATPRSAQWSRNGNLLAFAVSGFSNTVARVFSQSGSTFTATQSINEPNSSSTNASTGRDVAWSPDGQYLAVTYIDGNSLPRTTVRGFGVTSPGVIDTTISNANLSWSSDSRYLAVSRTGTSPTSRIYRVDNNTFTLIYESNIGRITFQN